MQALPWIIERARGYVRTSPKVVPLPVYINCGTTPAASASSPQPFIGQPTGPRRFGCRNRDIIPEPTLLGPRSFLGRDAPGVIIMLGVAELYRAGEHLWQNHKLTSKRNLGGPRPWEGYIAGFVIPMLNDNYSANSRLPPHS